ncbi:three-Cys-motif partner protein TcmP [Xanthomonas cannabis]|uniref:three-Cys-motif partner protein TcmP n=1 Tax=Xanthomonas cannabis TaxID=1885674 RepID=UPI000574ED02|nr:three-Cys-motif partner protein TcmP [Xanthomonas cannabis]KHL59195.1 hypothetical protein OZ10_02820 [Xanthomonas cannabis pv. cannabis]
MPTKRTEERYEIDPHDGLKAEVVGAWAQEKHARLRHYVDISRAARRKFDKNSTYIDLYCGPGRAKIKDTTIFIPGGALAAVDAARSVPFGSIHIADLDEANVQACRHRMGVSGFGPVNHLIGRAEDTAKSVVPKLSRTGLHFAFLDPYNVQSLPFEVLKTLAQMNRMDLLIHLSAMDLTRNVKQLMSSGALELFAPGWREHVDPAERNDLVVRAVVRHWCNLIRQLGYEDVSDRLELVSGKKNQPLYWLVLASKNELGRRFWGEVSNVTPQHRLPF